MSTATTTATDYKPTMPWARAYAQTLAWEPPPGEWAEKKAARLAWLVDMLPHGSGVDSALCLEDSTPERIVIAFSFHHMNENGMYDGWTDHTVIVTPSLQRGVDVRVTGRNRNDIKDYLADIFGEAVTDIVTITA